MLKDTTIKPSRSIEDDRRIARTPLGLRPALRRRASDDRPHEARIEFRELGSSSRLVNRCNEVRSYYDRVFGDWGVNIDGRRHCHCRPTITPPLTWSINRETRRFQRLRKAISSGSMGEDWLDVCAQNHVLHRRELMAHTQALSRRSGSPPFALSAVLAGQNQGNWIRLGSQKIELLQIYSGQERADARSDHRRAKGAHGDRGPANGPTRCCRTASRATKPARHCGLADADPARVPVQQVVHLHGG